LLGVAATHAADFWQRCHFGGALFSGTVGGGAIVGAIFRLWCHFGGAVFGGKVGASAIVSAIFRHRCQFGGANSVVPFSAARSAAVP
jgi:hypothetical protein